MKISRVDKIMEVYNTSKMKKIEKSKKKDEKDVLALSNQGKDFQSVLKAISKVPDIREEKVQEIKQKIQSGNYDISAEEVAEKIVESAFDTKI